MSALVFAQGRPSGEPGRNGGHARSAASTIQRRPSRPTRAASGSRSPTAARSSAAATCSAATGANYGKIANPDAPVWRAGANYSTQLKTEVPLVINGKTVAPGTYTMFIDLKPNDWTLIVSNWKAQTRYDPKNTAEIWGAYGYTPDKDVVRAPMTLATLPFSVDQLTWDFTDMSDAGGKLTIMWDKAVASVPFKIM